MMDPSSFKAEHQHKATEGIDDEATALVSAPPPMCGLVESGDQHHQVHSLEASVRAAADNLRRIQASLHAEEHSDTPETWLAETSDTTSDDTTSQQAEDEDQQGTVPEGVEELLSVAEVNRLARIAGKVAVTLALGLCTLFVLLSRQKSAGSSAAADSFPRGNESSYDSHQAVYFTLATMLLLLEVRNRTGCFSTFTQSSVAATALVVHLALLVAPLADVDFGAGAVDEAGLGDVCGQSQKSSDFASSTLMWWLRTGIPAIANGLFVVFIELLDKDVNSGFVLQAVISFGLALCSLFSFDIASVKSAALAVSVLMIRRCAVKSRAYFDAKHLAPCPLLRRQLASRLYTVATVLWIARVATRALALSDEPRYRFEAVLNVATFAVLTQLLVHVYTGFSLAESRCPSSLVQRDSDDQWDELQQVFRLLLWDRGTDSSHEEGHEEDPTVTCACLFDATTGTVQCLFSPSVVQLLSAANGGLNSFLSDDTTWCKSAINKDALELQIDEVDWTLLAAAEGAPKRLIVRSARFVGCPGAGAPSCTTESDIPVHGLLVQCAASLALETCRQFAQSGGLDNETNSGFDIEVVSDQSRSNDLDGKRVNAAFVATIRRGALHAEDQHSSLLLHTQPLHASNVQKPVSDPVGVDGYARRSVEEMFSRSKTLCFALNRIAERHFIKHASDSGNPDSDSEATSSAVLRYCQTLQDLESLCQTVTENMAGEAVSRNDYEGELETIWLGDGNELTGLLGACHDEEIRSNFSLDREDCKQSDQVCTTLDPLLFRFMYRLAVSYVGASSEDCEPSVSTHVSINGSKGHATIRVRGGLRQAVIDACNATQSSTTDDMLLASYRPQTAEASLSQQQPRVLDFLLQHCAQLMGKGHAVTMRAEASPKLDCPNPVEITFSICLASVDRQTESPLLGTPSPSLRPISATNDAVRGAVFKVPNGTWGIAIGDFWVATQFIGRRFLLESGVHESNMIFIGNKKEERPTLLLPMLTKAISKILTDNPKSKILVTVMGELLDITVKNAVGYTQHTPLYPSGRFASGTGLAQNIMASLPAEHQAQVLAIVFNKRISEGLSSNIVGFPSLPSVTEMLAHPDGRKLLNRFVSECWEKGLSFHHPKHCLEAMTGEVAGSPAEDVNAQPLAQQVEGLLDSIRQVSLLLEGGNPQEALPWTRIWKALHELKRRLVMHGRSNANAEMASILISGTTGQQVPGKFLAKWALIERLAVDAAEALQR